MKFKTKAREIGKYEILESLQMISGSGSIKNREIISWWNILKIAAFQKPRPKILKRQNNHEICGSFWELVWETDKKGMRKYEKYEKNTI